MSYPFYLPHRNDNSRSGKKILAVDIGGTKTSFGMFDVVGDRLSLIREDTYSSRSADTFQELVRRFLSEDVRTVPDVLSIGVAGPVLDNKVKLTNLSW